jgi:hypothetical protein
MKNFKQFMSESVNISGDFNGNLYINSQDQQSQEEVGESYVADITWQNSIYRIEMRNWLKNFRVNILVQWYITSIQ